MEGRRLLTGWGGTSPSVATVHPAGDDATLVRLVTEVGRRGVVARGLGRRYGAAAQAGGRTGVAPTPHDRAWAVGRQSFRIVLTQGLNRQIRRMCEHCGATVTALRRERFVNVELGALKLGYWRDLSPAELAGLGIR